MKRRLSPPSVRMGGLRWLLGLALLLGMSSLASSQPLFAQTGPFQEQNGIVVMEAESADSIPSNWAQETTFSGFTGAGYLRYAGSNQLSTPGTDIIEYQVDIDNPGTYQFQWRSRIGQGTNSTEHNDSWLKINADSFYGEKGTGSIVCPKGYNPAENDCTGSAPEGAGSGGWFKAYLSGSTNWTWSTNTSDNDAHSIYARFDAPGVYTIQVSGRSADHVIDRLVLHKSDYSGNPNDTSLPESPRAQVNPPSSDALYRVNVGGPEVVAADGSSPAWSQDSSKGVGSTNASPYYVGGDANLYSDSSGSAYAGPVDMSHPSLPPSAPASIFQTERWDPASGDEMQWEFPVDPGTEVEVRLFFAELFSGVDAAGERIFDVNVEGSVPAAFNDIDPFAVAGAKGAFMLSTQLTVNDGTLDIDFIHVVENPALKGIEILAVEGSQNQPPTVTNPGAQTSTEGDAVNLAIAASDPDAGDTLSYSATGLPGGLSIDPNSGVIAGTVATGAAANSPYNVTVTVTDDGTPQESDSAQFTWTINEPQAGNPAALIEVTPGAGVNGSTYGNNSFQIENIGNVNITSVSFDLSTAILPDVAFDPVGTAGDNAAKCLTANTTTGSPGYIAPSNNCTDPFSQPHNGVDNAEGYDVATVNFNDFNGGEAFNFSVDIDPTSIKNDTTSGDAGAISGFELIGATITVSFADGTVIVTSLYDEGSLGGSQAVAAPAAPSAPSISAAGITAPATVSDPNQTIVVNGAPGAAVSLLQADARLYIDAGGGGYDIDPFEANAVMAKTLYNGTLDGSGQLSIPVTLLQTGSSDAGPDGGLNHFVAVIEGAGEQTSQTSNVIVLEYDPTATEPSLVFSPTALSFTLVQGASDQQDAAIDTSDGSTMPTPAALSVSYDAASGSVEWLSVTSAMNQNTPYPFTVDATGLTPGTYEATVAAGSVNGYQDGALPVTLTVTEPAAPSALIEVNPGTGIDASTFNNNSFLIENTGDVNITSVSFDLSTAFLPDVVFDPTGTAGDSGAKCLSPNSGTAAVGLIDQGDECVYPFSQPHDADGDGTGDPSDGYDVLTVTFNDFNNGETFGFSTDIDPNSIKNDSNTGDAGAISGFELIGATVTVEFADGTTVVTNLFDDGSLGGSQAVAAPDAPAAPSISAVGVSAPAAVSNPNQTIAISGPPGASITLLQVDARLYIDDPSTGGGYEIDPFEANEALAKVLYNATLDGNGQAAIPVTLLETASPNAGPDGGINHFVAVVDGSGEQTSQTSNVVVLELVDEPQDASLTGTMTLQGCSDHSGPLSVLFYTSGNGTPVYTFTPSSDAAGSFTVTGIQPGTYEVSVKQANHLQVVETVTLTTGSNSADFGQLPAGDANNDNFVTAPDFSLLASAFNTQAGDSNYNAQADFNCDTFVTAPDFSLLAGNFNTAGEMPSGAQATQSAPAVLRLAENGPVALAAVTERAALSQGETVTVELWVDAGAQAVDTASAVLTFDPSVVRAEAVEAGGTFDTELWRVVDNDAGTVRYEAGMLNGAFPSGRFLLARVQLRAVANGGSPLALAGDTSAYSNGVNLLGAVQDVNIAVHSGQLESKIHLPLIQQ